MGTSGNGFYKYPRTPHLSGSSGTLDDKRLSKLASDSILTDKSLIVEEKVDGTNVGIHFESDGRHVLQCRGHEITAGMHPQYDLFKQWCAAKRELFESVLEDRFIVYGEWMYAKHSVHYRELAHYFFEFDIFDKQREVFLDLESRMAILEPTGIPTVPVVHRSDITWEGLLELIGPSRFGAVFENPLSNQTENLMEGLYVRTESDGIVTARAKYVRPEFTEKVKQSTHWQYQAMIPNQLADGVDIWS